MPEPVPPDTNMLSRASMQALQELEHLGRRRPEPDRGPRPCTACVENFRTVMTGPTSDSGSMIALTREPSGRRASTRGLVSSMRRPSGVMIRSMIRRTCSSFRKYAVDPQDLAVALDVDVVRAVDHDLGDRLVVEERLERPEAR